MSDHYYTNSLNLGGRFFVDTDPRKHYGFWVRLAEAQRTYDNAKPGDCIQIDEDLLPYINRTEK